MSTRLCTWLKARINGRGIIEEVIGGRRIYKIIRRVKYIDRIEKR